MRVTDCTFVAEKPTAEKEFHCELLHSQKLRLILLDFRAIFASDEIEIEKANSAQGLAIFIFLRSVYLFFFFYPHADRNINGDPTFSAAVIPVIKTC